MDWIEIKFTDEDLAQIKKRYIFGTDEKLLRNHVASLQTRIRDALTDGHSRQLCSLAAFLDKLLEQVFDDRKSPLDERQLSSNGLDQMDAVRTAWRDQIKTDAEESCQDWRDDPDAWKGWYPQREADEHGPVEHPWTDESVHVGLRVMSWSLYDLWLHYSELDDAMQDAAHEALRTFCRSQDDMPNLQRLLDDRFDEIVKRVVKAEKAAALQDAAAFRVTRIIQAQERQNAAASSIFD